MTHIQHEQREETPPPNERPRAKEKPLGVSLSRLANGRFFSSKRSPVTNYPPSQRVRVVSNILTVTVIFS